MENQLIEDCKRRKKGAFERLYQKYSSKLLGVCFRYSKSREEAEDILQEGMIKVFQNIESFSGKGSFEGWLKRIMVNTAINNYRRNAKYIIDQEFNENLPDKTLDEEIKISDRINKEKLFECIHSLPRGYQLVFNMYAIDGLTHNEIANELKISVNTSKSQLHKARRHLRKQLQDIIEK